MAKNTDSQLQLGSQSSSALSSPLILNVLLVALMTYYFISSPPSQQPIQTPPCLTTNRWPCLLLKTKSKYWFWVLLKSSLLSFACTVWKIPKLVFCLRVIFPTYAPGHHWVCPSAVLWNRLYQLPPLLLSLLAFISSFPYQLWPWPGNHSNSQCWYGTLSEAPVWWKASVGVHVSDHVGGCF